MRACRRLLAHADQVAQVLAGADVGTCFHPTGKRAPARLLWLAHATTARGGVRLDAGAVTAVVAAAQARCSRPASWPSRATFSAGDPIDLLDESGVAVARGLVAYDAAELPALLGRSTRELGETLGSAYSREVVHRDDLVLLDSLAFRRSWTLSIAPTCRPVMASPSQTHAASCRGRGPRTSCSPRRNYWVCTTRADGRPHAMPVWGLWLDDAVLFSTDPESVKARNLAARPDVVVHLESGDDVVVVDGRAERLTGSELPADFVDALRGEVRRPRRPCRSGVRLLPGRSRRGCWPGASRTSRPPPPASSYGEGGAVRFRA